MAQQNKPIQAAETIDAVIELGQMLSVDIMDNTWGSLTCEEAEAFAYLFRVAGFVDLADSIIEQHGWHDDEGDEHYSEDNAAIHADLHN